MRLVAHASRAAVPVLFSLLLLLPDASAQPLSASKRRPAQCPPSLPPTVARIPLSAVLRDLGEGAPFIHHEPNAHDPLVWHPGGSPLMVMTALSHQANVIVRYRPAPGCAAAWQVESVWVLPSLSTAHASTIVTATPTAPAPVVAPVSEVQMYLRAHGMAGATNKQ